MRCLPLLMVLTLPLLAAPAGGEKVSDLLEAISKNERDPFGQRDRESAIRRLGENPTVEAARAMIPLFTDPFEHIADHALSAWIRQVKEPVVRRWIAGDALRDRRPEVRRAAAAALAFAEGDEETAAALAAALPREKDPGVLAALAGAAARAPASPALGAALRGLLAHAEGTVVLAAARALARQGGEAEAEALAGALGHKAPLARAGAVEGLAALDALPPDKIAAILADPAPEPKIALALGLADLRATFPVPGPGGEALVTLLADPGWRVRAAAIQGALLLWRPAVVTPLIDRLGTERGRLRDDLRRALETLTGQGFGEDAELWRAWWEGREGSFKPGPRPKPDRGGRIPFADAGGKEAAGGSVAFFRVPIRSERILFLFDLSGSMRNPADGQEGSKSKLDLLREEFGKTMAALPAETRFDLLVYRYPSSYPPQPKLTRAFGRLEAATRTSRKRAQDWLSAQEAEGWGAFYEPLLAAMEEDADTVILLSDGRPSRGRFDRDFRILAELPEAHRFRQLAVSTVLVGTSGADRKFMADLAAATGGFAREAGGE